MQSAWTELELAFVQGGVLLIPRRSQETCSQYGVEDAKQSKTGAMAGLSRETWQSIFEAARWGHSSPSTFLVVSAEAARKQQRETCSGVGHATPRMLR